MQEVEIRITGKVQQVMFRDFAQRKARALWLTGTAENVADGSLRVIAQGPEEKLRAFVEHLHKGPFLARVSNVTVNWRDARETYNDFSIVY
jgi:acylphosphatase